MFIIRSEQQQGYWSNALGWVYDVASATHYPKRNGPAPSLFIPDAEYVPAAEAKDFPLD